MICEHCKANCPEGAHFCSYCGRPMVPLRDEISKQADPEESAAETVEVGTAPVQPVQEPADAAPVQCAEEPTDDAEQPVQEVVHTADDQPAQEINETAQPAPVGNPWENPQFSTPARQQGSYRAPLLIMLGMILIGLLGFLFLRGGQVQKVTEQSSEYPWLAIEDGGLVSFIPEKYSGSGTLEIPETVAGVTVRGISPHGFEGADLETVILPDTVRFIGESAFEDCKSLRGIFLPEGITEIGSDAFRDCNHLEAICIPGTVGAIGNNAFRGCNMLRFVFYSGYFVGWEKLYGDYINPFTVIICADGQYRQQVRSPREG